MRFVPAAPFLIAGLLIAGCASTSRIATETERLRQTDREWSAAASEGKDVERIASFWSDDATIIPAGAPVVRGKAAIRNFVQQSLAIPGFHISWRTDEVSVSADGTMGYTVGENSMTVPGADGKLMTVNDRGVSIWRRDSGGNWKCVVDMWNAGQ